MEWTRQSSSKHENCVYLDFDWYITATANVSGVGFSLSSLLGRWGQDKEDHDRIFIFQIQKRLHLVTYDIICAY